MRGWERPRFPQHPIAWINDWFATETRRRATKRFRGGTYVSDLVLVACEEKLAEAWVLSQILWQFGADREGAASRPIPRTKLIRRNFLWRWQSSRNLERQLGLPRTEARRALEYLVDNGLLIREQWIVRDRAHNGQPTNHYRPNVAELEKAFQSVDVICRAHDLGSDRMGDVG